MANDNPKKDSEVDFVQDILPAFGKKIEESAATQLGIKQRTTRSLQRNADMGCLPTPIQRDTLRTVFDIITSFLYRLSLMRTVNTSRV